ncbi:conserved Plasmodium membrane protein, unknown function [Plasmodium relictum]|uniref:Uncharacterized protein n=1 Tax=Plasmodium relictum TaxID=85471 RepID=A0A1J1H2L4_PLARL|nr:conserved Plasmodium membrane protein, unknown function [Plasmodium relictum]CRG99092.1 conserved Plasmodium membrane protein, unknown function [Plasmodium relictum]
MEDLEIKQALFKKENEKNSERCAFCKTRYRKFINTFMTWEVVLLLTHILVFLIIFYKLIMDKKLSSVNNRFIRSITNVGHFTQGFLFVLLLVPFKFTKKITKFLINTCNQKDIQENDIEENANDNENENKLSNSKEKEKKIKFDSNEDANMIMNNESSIDKNTDEGLTEYLSDENEIKKKESLQEKSVQEKKKRVYFNEAISVKESDNIYEKNKNTGNSVCESFTNKLVFCGNTSNHKKKEIQYFFLCAKLFSTNKNYVMFVIKYVTSFILMFAYPLYNLIKRKILYKYFYFSSYYINLFDFASGLSAGSSLVLIYGLTKFFISYYANRKKGEDFQFYGNYAFINDINCLCDENIKINIQNNPYLKNIAINYFNSYYNYKNLLFGGLIILLVICIFSFGFSFISLNAYKLIIQ